MFIPDAIEGLATLGLWVILYLCHHPHIQAKCQLEVGIICLGKGSFTIQSVFQVAVKIRISVVLKYWFCR